MVLNEGLDVGGGGGGKGKKSVKRETQGAFCVLNTNAKLQTRKSMKINVICAVEERFFISSREFCPAHRRGHWCFALMAYCASVFACACSVLLITCLHTYTGYK